MDPMGYDDTPQPAQLLTYANQPASPGPAPQSQTDTAALMQQLAQANALRQAPAQHDSVGGAIFGNLADIDQKNKVPIGKMLGGLMGGAGGGGAAGAAGGGGGMADMLPMLFALM